MSKIVSTTVTFGKYTERAISKLKQAGHEIVVNTKGVYYTQDELVMLGREHPETEALIVGGDHINQQVIRAFPKLKVIAMHGVGVDKIDRDYAASKNIIVTNTPGANSLDVAEYVVSLMIVANRQFYLGMRDMKAGIWKKRVGRRISGQTLGIIGVGSIGVVLAKAVSGLGVSLLGVDPYPDKRGLDAGVTYVSLEELLRKSDIISLHAPASKGAPPVIKREQLALVKSEAIIINAARAPLVDLDAVEEALEMNRLGGFVTDVYEVEPPSERKLWLNDKVIVTPHGGGGTIQANIAMGEMAVDNVLDVLRGGTGVTPVRSGKE